MTTQALGERGAIDALVLGALTGGGETPPANMAEVGVDMPSHVLNVYGLKETSDTCEMKGWTWTITGSFK